MNPTNFIQQTIDQLAGYLDDIILLIKIAISVIKSKRIRKYRMTLIQMFLLYIWFVFLSASFIWFFIYLFFNFIRKVPFQCCSQSFISDRLIIERYCLLFSLSHLLYGSCFEYGLVGHRFIRLCPRVAVLMTYFYVLFIS